MPAEHGEERTAAEGEFLFRIGDARYPFIVVLEGEAAVLDASGNEVARTRWSSRARSSAVRPTPRAGSRTTSGSRGASAARS